MERGHDPHYYAIYDDKHRMMVLICHNNHFGDGWEHETDDESYFDTFSEPMAYPMFINILVSMRRRIKRDQCSGHPWLN